MIDKLNQAADETKLALLNEIKAKVLSQGTKPEELLHLAEAYAAVVGADEG
jgi:hypothetical protein